MAKFTDLDLLAIGNTIQITGCVYSGEGKHFICFFPGDGSEADFHPLEGKDVEVLAMNRDEWTQFLRQTDIMEAEVLQQASDGKLAKAIVRKSARQISQHVSWTVFRRDGYKCRYCGADDLPLTVDHLVLWEELGPSTEENLVAACRKCNKTRGNTPYAEWLKHDYYRRVSSPHRTDGKGLSPAEHQANVDLLETLDAIPRMTNKPTKR